MANDEAFFGSENSSRSDRNMSGNHSISSRNVIRQQLQAQVEEFLAKGGKISELPPNARAEIIHRPETDQSLLE